MYEKQLKADWAEIYKIIGDNSGNLNISTNDALNRLINSYVSRPEIQDYLYSDDPVELKVAEIPSISEEDRILKKFGMKNPNKNG